MKPFPTCDDKLPILAHVYLNNKITVNVQSSLTFQTRSRRRARNGFLLRSSHSAVGKSLDSFLGVGSCLASCSGTRGVRQLHYNAYDVLGRRSNTCYLKLNKKKS
jgi:hypothetical protein